MKKVEDISQESKDLAALIANRPQIDQMLDYYKGILTHKEEMFESFQERINTGYVVSKSLVFGFIPIKTKQILDRLDMAELKMKMVEISNEVYNFKQYFESWKRRKEDYELRMDKVTRECNEHFDKVLEMAKEIKTNPQVLQVIAEYKNPKNDQDMKNEFFLYLKQCINNSQIHGNKSKKQHVGKA